MSVDIAELGLSVRSDGVVVADDRLAELERTARRSETAAERLGKSWGQASKQMRDVGRSMTLYVTTPILAAGAAAVKLAVDAEETANKFDVVFRGSVERSEQALSELSKTIPLTLTEMKGMAAQLQDMLVPMGLVRKEAADLSVTAVQLAGDIASFNNVGTDEVLANIGSALAGQSEPLRKYGIDVRKTRLEAIALAEGLVQVGEEMDNAAVAQATFIAIQQDSADAMGDAARTMNSTANETRFLTRDIKQLAEDVGKDLVPVYGELLGVLQDGLKIFQDFTPEQRKLAIQVAALAAAFGPLLIVFASVARALAIIIPLIIQLASVITLSLLPAVRLAMIRFAGLVGALGFGPAVAALLGPTGLFITGAAALGVFAFAMRDTEREATELDVEINQLIESMQNFGRTSFDLVIAKLSLAIGQNDKLIDSLRESLDLQIQLQSVPAGALGADTNTAVAVNLAEQLRAAEAEGARLREQLLKLAEAQNEFTLKTAAANKELETPPPPILTWAEDEIKALEDLRNTIDPLTAATKRYADARALLDKALLAGKVNPTEYSMLVYQLQRSTLAADAFGAIVKRNTALYSQHDAALREMEDGFAWLDDLVNADDAFRAFQQQFDPATAALNALADARRELTEAWENGSKTERESYERMLEGIDRAEEALTGMRGKMVDMMSETVGELEKVKDMFHEDSAAAEALSGVIQMLNVVLGIMAVIKQLSEGDVYSAIPRAIGVAALIASMGVQTGASAGSIAATPQESQGTGTVLGDTEAKTESILRASEITADATSELVGINRGMLHALQALQVGITGAVVRLARGGDVGLDSAMDDFRSSASKFIDALAGAGKVNLFGLNFVGEWFAKFLGGKAKLLDTGIQIEGGKLSDLINDVLVRAFADFDVKKYIFDDYDLKTKFADLDDGIGKQFALVFMSIRDTVVEAALAMGISMDEIQSRIETFNIETQKISFKDLTAEEQQEELLAVFGAIFDDLALQVVPFIGQFQKVGEGLGETLVRVATSVQVFQEAATALGFAADASDPEAFAQMAVGLVELAGGVEEFISKFSTFFDKFASDERKLEFATSQLTRAFEGVGLTIPDTRDGMIDLMMSMDATTEEGRKQIAMLLEIADVADQYYTLVERMEKERLDTAIEMTEEMKKAAVQQIIMQREILGAFTNSGIYSGLQQLRRDFRAATEAADALGASQREYVMIAKAFHVQLRRMAAELALSVISMTEQLFAQETDIVDAVVSEGLEKTREVANSVFEEWQRALEEIYDFTQSILLDEELTTLTPAEQFSEAQSQFDDLLSKALGGNVEAAAALPAAAQALLKEARFMFASGAQYQAIFDKVLAALEQVKMPGGVTPTVIVEGDDPGIGDPGSEEEKTAAQIMAEQLERLLTAMDLAGAIRDLAQVLNTTVFDVMAQLNVPLDKLVEVMGVNINKLDETTARGLGDIAHLLGVGVLDLVAELGVDLEALAEASGVHLSDMSALLVEQLADFSKALGMDVIELVDALGLSIADLAETFDVGVASFSAEQFDALVRFSKSLGAGISDVVEALDLKLGSISDETSILSTVLDDAIADLPEGIQADLGPLLVAIRTATTAADAKAAIQDLGAYIVDLPADISANLLPILDLIGYKAIAPELAALADIEQNTWAMVGLLTSINEILGYVPPVPDVDPNPVDIPDLYEKPDDKYRPPTPPVEGVFAEGGAVAKTGLYQMHAGEFVVTKTADNLSVSSGGDELSSEELAEIKQVLIDMREQNRRYQEIDLSVSRGMELSLKQQAETARRVANA